MSHSLDAEVRKVLNAIDSPGFKHPELLKDALTILVSNVVQPKTKLYFYSPGL